MASACEAIFICWCQAFRDLESRMAQVFADVFSFRFVATPWAAPALPASQPVASSNASASAQPPPSHPHDARPPTAFESFLQQSYLCCIAFAAGIYWHGGVGVGAPGR